jgi:hypothetical protein
VAVSADQNTAWSEFEGTLSPRHLGLVKKSGIAPWVCRRRGYRTLTTKAELDRIGFGPSQQLTPTLLIPLYSVSGETSGYQHRPDLPRQKNGKVIKYETAAGMRMMLDVHPLLSMPRTSSGSAAEGLVGATTRDLPPLIADPGVPLLITEGIRKADAAVSIGMCCVGLLGVWNWRGSNELGGKTTLADWESIALNGRRACIAFDSDVTEKREVHTAMGRLRAFLKSRGAMVQMIYLPAGEHGSKVGLDDYIAGAKAAGRSDAQIREALLALARDELRKLPTDPAAHPVITLIPGKRPDIVDHAEGVLVDNAERLKIFQRAGEIVRVISLSPDEAARAKKRDGLDRPDGTIVIHSLTGTALLEIFDRLITWQAIDRDGEAHPKDCPAQVANFYLSRVGSWKLPHLAGVIEAPILRQDGTGLVVPGYDHESGLFLDCDGDWPAMPERPTRTVAEAALRTLMEPFAEFPFAAEDEDRSVLVAAILTALQRRLLETAPLFGFSAPSPRSGKSMLAEAIGIIATGRLPAAAGFSRQSEELRKVITSSLREGHSMVNFDNIVDPLDSPDLARALTQLIYLDRLLGTNTTLRLRTNVLWTATGNNLTVKGDMASRTLLCRIDAKTERPEEREFRIPDLRAHLMTNRKRLVIAGLTILRAYRVAGQPRPNVKPWGGFDQWSREIRAALLWLGLSDPCRTRERIMVSDPEREITLSLLEQWHAALGDSGMVVADVISAATHELKEAMLSVAADRLDHTNIDSRRLGAWCRSVEDRIVGGFKLSREGSRRRATVWRVSQVSPVSPKPVDPNGAARPEGDLGGNGDFDRAENDSPNSPDSPD